MKKLTYVILITLKLFILVGCQIFIGEITDVVVSDEEPAAAASEAAAISLEQRGAWHGHIYVNDFIGIQFEMPETWFRYSAEEKAFLFDTRAAFISGIREESWLLPTPEEIPLETQIMRVEDFMTGNGVSIVIHEMAEGEIPSESEILEQFFPLLDELGFHDIQIGSSPRRIGDADWYYVNHEFWDGVQQSCFVSVRDGFLRMVIIGVHTENTGDLDNIWALFSEIEPRFQSLDGLAHPEDASAPSVSRGFWDGDDYINPHLNIRFAVPERFRAFSDEELASGMRLSADLLDGDTISPELWLEVFPHGGTVVIMSAHDERNDAFVRLAVHQIPRGMRYFPIHEHLQNSLGEIEASLYDRGFDVAIVDFPGIIEISGKRWYSGSVMVTVQDREFPETVFLTEADEHIWGLSISSTGAEELNEILDMFSEWR